MNELAQRLHEAAITLENDAEFHNAYTVLDNCSYADARSLIHGHGKRLGLRAHVAVAESREQLRRYFDETYNLSETRYCSTNSLVGTPTIEFWKDSVREGREVAEATDSKPTFVIGQLWDTSFVNRDVFTRERHGKPWTEAELDRLEDLFLAHTGLEEIAIMLKRPASGIVTKLTEHFRFLYRQDLGDFKYQYVISTHAVQRELELSVKDHTTKAQQHFDKVDVALTEKEPIMNKTAIIEVTTKTLVNGTDVKELDDSAIYDLIAQQEAEIKRLEAIENKPKKLVAEIEKRRAGIKALVDYLDSKAD